jgi:hypothetical protein
MRLPARLAGGTPAIPLADAGSLRRQAQRTLAVRLILAALLVGCLLAAVALSRDATGARKTFFAGGKSSVLVIDSSASIGPAPHARIGRAMRKLVDAHSSFGLVFFSDTAYEAVPPGTRWTELEPFLRFFRPRRPPARDQSGRPVRLRRRQAENPWAALRGGTRISTGLRLARTILRREHDTKNGVLLLSDLDNSLFDMPALTHTLTRYAADGIKLRVIGLGPSREDEEFFAKVLGADALVTSAELAPPRGGTTRSVVTASTGTPLGLMGAALALLLLLGANEHWSARLRWRQASERESA